MEIDRVAFFGHREIENIFAVEDILLSIIENMLYSGKYVEFLVGNNGDFDMCVARAVRRAKRLYRDDNSRLILVLPYMISGYRKYPEDYHNYYDEIEISAAASRAHPKAAIQIRNREMVDKADHIICYVKHKYGGAYDTIKYAENKDIFIYNIANYNLE